MLDLLQKLIRCTNKTIFDLIIYHYRLSPVALVNVTFSNVDVGVQEHVDILLQFIHLMYSTAETTELYIKKFGYKCRNKDLWKAS